MSNTTSAAAVGERPIEPAGWQPPQRKSLLSYAKQVDPLMLFIWVAFTTFQFGFGGPLRYMAAAYFAVAFFLFARQTMPAAARAWPAFILVILCVISALWAPSYQEALRKGVALAMTAVMAIYVGNRLSGRQILACYFIVEAIVALMCLRSPTPVNGAWTGFFGQKNYYAMHMFILYVSAMGLALDRQTWKWLRIIAAVYVPLAFFMIMMARSGTQTLLVAGATAVFLGQYFLWQPASRIRHARTFIILLTTVLALIGAFVIFAILQIDVYEKILQALGKDSTLTGRTYLWGIAERVMDEHPLTGVGANGFWRPEYGITDSIAKYFDYEKYIGFSFHNSYYENGVMYGYPGFFATIFLSTWAIGSAGMNWLRNQTVINATFLIFVAMIVVRSNSEADLAGELSGLVVLLLISASRKELGRRQPGDAPFEHAEPVVEPRPSR